MTDVKSANTGLIKWIESLSALFMDCQILTPFIAGKE